MSLSLVASPPSGAAPPPPAADSSPVCCDSPPPEHPAVTTSTTRTRLVTRRIPERTPPHDFSVPEGQPAVVPTVVASPDPGWSGRFFSGADTLSGVSDPLTTGCEALDAALGGGVERGVVTQLYGPPASGKTNVALTVAAEAAAAGERVLYVDTEDLSVTRFRDIATARAEGTPVAELTERLIVSEATSFDEQSEAVRDTEELADRVGLIVLDSATGFYRLERTGEDREGETLRAVARQITHLLALAKRHDLAVIVTNQVFTDPDADRTRPLGGNTLEHWTGVVLGLERFRGGNRRATVEKHRSEPAGERARFQITDTGIEDADPQ